MRAIWRLAFILALVSSASPSWSRPSFPDRHDRDIRTAARLWMPSVPWRLWKAQLYQESRLDPAAVSPVGAAGIAQFMPATWAEVSRAMGYAGIPRSAAAPAIHAGAYFMATLRHRWRDAAVEKDRHNLALASYNAGAGNVSRALALDGGSLGAGAWTRVARGLPRITGRHATETTGYVRAIWRWFAMMEAGV